MTNMISKSNSGKYQLSLISQGKHGRTWCPKLDDQITNKIWRGTDDSTRDTSDLRSCCKIEKDTAKLWVLILCCANMYIHPHLLPFHRFAYHDFCRNFPSILTYSYILQGNKEDNHLQQPYVSNQQDWREWDYLVAVVSVGRQVMRTAASSPATSATPRISLDIDAEQETRGFGAEAPKVVATDSCHALLIKS
jgi:hypothetical protein